MSEDAQLEGNESKNYLYRGYWIWNYSGWVNENMVIGGRVTGVLELRDEWDGRYVQELGNFFLNWTSTLS